MSVHVKTCTNAYIYYGEQRVRDFLEEKLKDQGYAELLMNCCVPSTPNALEIDLTLINRYGVFMIEVKDFFGTIVAKDGKWERSHGPTITNPLGGIEHKARVGHGFLTGQEPDWENVNVAGLVVLANDEDQLSGSEKETRKTYQLDDKLIKALTSNEWVPRRRGRRRQLDQSTIRDVRKVFYTARPPGQMQEVAGYPICSSVQRGHFHDLEGTDPEFKNRRVRIKQYDIPVITSKKQLMEARELFKRDMRALLEAKEHPHLLIPYRFIPDPSSDHLYYLVIQWVDGPTFSKRIEERQTVSDIPLCEQLSILQPVADALLHCHDHGVVHRNLTPEAIYITADHRVKVGDFDFAKLPPVTRSYNSTGLLQIDTQYASPEVSYNVHNVDGRADIYSLGAVWYDMIFERKRGQPVVRARIPEAPLPLAAKALLNDMLQEPREKRPASMAEVKARLAEIAAGAQAAAQVEG